MEECEKINKECSCENTELVKKMVSGLTPVFRDFFEKWYKNDFESFNPFSKVENDLMSIDEEIPVSIKNENGKYEISIDIGEYKPEETIIEVNRSERTVTINCLHEVKNTSSEGSLYHSTKHAKIVETIPDFVDVYSIKKEFKNNKLIITGNDIEERDDTENIVKL